MLNNSLATCREFLFDQLLENWQNNGLDQEKGFSYESLKHDWSRNKVGRVRLLTQCRQLYTFSHALSLKPNAEWQARLTPLFDFIIEYYLVDGRWIFSLDDELNVLETKTDAYALAFILLSFSHYYQVSNDQRAISLMKDTHHFLVEKMSAPSGGFYEAYPVDTQQVRRQNPHMHLLEGYIAAFQTTQDEAYKTVIQSLLELALEHFYDKESKSLLEFFQADWKPDPQTGHQVEPGHHFEWVWLLYQANKILPNQEYLELAQQLWSTAVRYGMGSNGGVYNQISNQGYQALDKEKRIWPITEYLKAITVLPIGKDEKCHRIENALAFMQEYYFLENGRWNEYLTQDNHPKDFPLPGTSSYHIFLGVTEVLTWAQELN
ncbi:AGE family epimerase/isomerase [Marinomonas epiphytica]